MQQESQRIDMKYISYGIMIFIMIAILFALAIDSASNPHGNSDPPGGRSGMDVLTDHLTGRQYLYRRGAITLRMDRDGKQICIATGIQQ